MSESMILFLWRRVSRDQHNRHNSELRENSTAIIKFVISLLVRIMLCLISQLTRYKASHAT